MVRSTATCLALITAAALYFVLVELHRPSLPAQDVYAFFIPNMVQAARGISAAGKGLLWNPFQSCGQPFLANPGVGLLYPLHLFFLVLDPNTAVHVLLIINMIVGAAGMLALGREMGLRWPAALAGALAFELGDPMGQLAGWSPMHNGSWAWVPWALFFGERLLRAPSRRGVAGLAGALTLSMLPGFVLGAVMAYQLIGLRLMWALLVERRAHVWRSIGAVSGGLALAGLLGALQLLPAAEMARESLRTALVNDILRTLGRLSMAAVDNSVAARVPPVPFMATALVLSGVAMTNVRRTLPVFYLSVAVLYAVLALGTATPLFSLYLLLPMAADLLRIPARFFWITGFCFTVLTAYGVEGLFELHAGSLQRRWVPAVVAAVLAALLAWAVPGGLRWAEAAALVAIVIAFAAAAWRPTATPNAAWIIIAAIVVSLAAVPLRWPGRLFPSASVLNKHVALFEALRPTFTPQDRIYIQPDAASTTQLALPHKLATLVQMPDVEDYDALTSQRLNGYVSMLWQGLPLRTFSDLTHRVEGSGIHRRLLDLAAVRYLVLPPRSAPVAEGLGLTLAIEAPDLRIYRNPDQLPRARWVPRVEVVDDPEALLIRLANGSEDLTAVAFVEQTPASGFIGTDDAHATGFVRILINDPEHIVMKVDGSTRGFVVIADQFFPGWRANINGVPVPIQRANYLFRAIEVPKGTSRLELEYRPIAVEIGAALSAAGLAIMAILIFRRSTVR